MKKILLFSDYKVIYEITYKIIEEAFARTRKARQYILDDIMKPVISAPREEL